MPKKPLSFTILPSLFAIALLFFFLFMPSADAEPVDPTVLVENWMKTYYKHPNPDGVVNAIRILANNSALGSTDKMTAFGFLVQVLRQNPEKIADWFQQLNDLDEMNKKQLMLIIWQSKTLEGDRIIDSIKKAKNNPLSLYADELTQTPQVDLLQENITSPAGLDMLWGSFFATGSPLYVEKIITLIGWEKANNNVSSDEKMDNVVTVSAARWSLIAYAVQQESVYEIEKRYLNNAPSHLQPMLQQILITVKRQKAKGQ